LLTAAAQLAKRRTAQRHGLR